MLFVVSIHANRLNRWNSCRSIRVVCALCRLSAVSLPSLCRLSAVSLPSLCRFATQFQQWKPETSIVSMYRLRCQHDELHRCFPWTVIHYFRIPLEMPTTIVSHFARNTQPRGGGRGWSASICRVYEKPSRGHTQSRKPTQRKNIQRSKSNHTKKQFDRLEFQRFDRFTPTGTTNSSHFM